MNTPESILKDLILSKYRSIHEFTKAANIPYSTLDSILKRGIKKSSVDSLLKVCHALDISPDYLIHGASEDAELTQSKTACLIEKDYTKEQWNRLVSYANFLKYENI